MVVGQQVFAVFDYFDFYKVGVAKLACEAGDAHCFFGVACTTGVGQQGDAFRHVIKNVGKSAAVGAAQSKRKDFRTGLLYGCFN